MSLNWDEESAGTPWYKTIDVSFLADMGGDLCGVERCRPGGRLYCCIRLPGHTGRHLAVDFYTRYPTAVW